MINDGVASEAKEKIIAVVSALVPEAKIYLYGSRARGTYKSWSDIDLALDAGHPIEPRGRIAELRDVLRELSIIYRVDVVDFNNISGVFKEEVTFDRVLWKE